MQNQWENQKNKKQKNKKQKTKNKNNSAEEPHIMGGGVVTG